MCHHVHAFGRLPAGVGFAVAGMWVVVLALRPDSSTIVAVAFGILGFFMLPVLPLALSSGAEVGW
jgi:hypothetical protein